MGDGGGGGFGGEYNRDGAITPEKIFEEKVVTKGCPLVLSVHLCFLSLALFVLLHLTECVDSCGTTWYQRRGARPH